jgi:hypothetical protein
MVNGELIVEVSGQLLVIGFLVFELVLDLSFA